MSLTEITERLYDLRRDRSSGHEKPYKPALLLCLIDLIEKGRFPDNRIFLTEELIERYSEYIRLVGGPNDTARIQYPFWHLCGDGVWRILDDHGKPLYRPGETAGKAPSVSRLREAMSHAALSEELFHHLRQPVEREALRNAIVSRYFPAQRNLLDALRREFLKQPSQVDESPEHYEKDPVRNQAFARTIKQVYDYRCAACGIRVRFRDLVLVEACHLIPFSESFNDHPTNGMALCKNHHWALDRQLIAPRHDDNGQLVWEPSPLLDERVEGQNTLIELDGKRVLAPAERKFRPALEAIAWRRERLLGTKAAGSDAPTPLTVPRQP